MFITLADWKLGEAAGEERGEGYLLCSWGKGCVCGDGGDIGGGRWWMIAKC